MAHASASRLVPDPHGAAGQRWFDGERYTEHFVPARPPIYPSGQTVVVGGTNHALHAILTIFTCGLWAPIWVLVAIFERPRVYVPAVVTPAPPGWYSNPNGQGTRYWDGRTWTIVSIPYTPPPRPVGGTPRFHHPDRHSRNCGQLLGSWRVGGSLASLGCPRPRRLRADGRVGALGGRPYETHKACPLRSGNHRCAR